MEQRFRRQALHDLVWSEPLTHVAPGLGISDVALAKICKRHGIPVPQRGHWAKLGAGKPSPRIALPPRALGAAETIHIGQSNWDERHAEALALMQEDVPPHPEFDEPLADVIARVTRLVGAVAPSRSLRSPHRIVAKMLADDAVRHEKWSQSSYPSRFDQPFYISPYEQRRLKLVDSIFKAASRAGMTPLGSRRKNPGEFSIKVGDSVTRFTLGKPNEERQSWDITSDARRPASEPMQLKVVWWGHPPGDLTLAWMDTPEAPLESLLAEIVTHLIVLAEVQVRASEHHWYRRRAERKEELIEAERQRKEEERRKERERQRRLENARIEKLLHEAMSLRLADDIRRYVAAVNARNTGSTEPVPEPTMAEWSQWALEQAKRIDPVQTAALLEPVPEPKEPPSSAERRSNAASPEGTTQAWHPNRWYTRLHR